MENVYNLTAPATQTQQVLDAASLRSAGFKGSTYIQSVLIDNPTGCWLLLTSDNTFIPPYVIGWAHNLDYSATETSVLFVATGPAGQLSTNFATTGSLAKVRVVIYDHQVQESSGNPFVTRQDQPEVGRVGPISNYTGAASSLDVNTNILGGSLVKRLRVYSVYIQVLNGQANRPTVQTVVTVIEVGNILALLNDVITPNKLSAQQIPPGGFIDLSLGSEINIHNSWGDAEVNNVFFQTNINFAIL